MLIKLLKHEYKAGLKAQAPFLIGFLALSGFMRILSLISENDQGGLRTVYFVFITFFSIGGFMLVVYPFIMGTNRFSKTLFGDEGYLMHTLPVPSHFHILSHLICTVTWFFVDTTAMGFGFTVAYANMNSDYISARDFTNIFSDIFNNYESVKMTVLVLTLYFVVLLAAVLICFFCVTVTSLLSRMRKPAGFGLFFAAFIIIGVVTSLITEHFSNRSYYDSYLTQTFGTNIVFFVILCVGMYFTTNHIMKNKLNLD